MSVCALSRIETEIVRLNGTSLILLSTVNRMEQVR